jgi:hypothetical protein
VESLARESLTPLQEMDVAQFRQELTRWNHEL